VFSQKIRRPSTFRENLPSWGHLRNSGTAHIRH
jgi:hypothetical protein